jgi:cytochrome c oxidase subunit II
VADSLRVRALRRTAAVPVALLLTALSLPCIAQDEAAASPYLLCAGCHGLQGEGNADLKAPPLAGQSATYVARQLAKYKSGQRAYLETDESGQVMKAIAQTLENDEARLKVADFVSKMPRIQASLAVPAAPATPGRAAEGGKIFAACAGCHGEHGEGRALANAPDLELLPDWYLKDALQDFRSGARGAHPGDYEGRTMRVLVRLIPDDQSLRDLVAYLDAL